MVELVADIAKISGSGAFVEENFPELLELGCCLLLQTLIRITNQSIALFLFASQELLDQLFLPRKQLSVQKYFTLFDCLGLFNAPFFIILFTHL